MEPGTTLSHYRLIEKIGEGGMGVVWKAEDTILGRTVAIKVLPADVSRDESRRSMFLSEARLASQVNSAHIVQVHEFARAEDLDFIAMEYVDGKPLSQILNGRPLPPEKVAALGLQVAKAVSSAHRRGVLHRDLKPGNVLVTGDGDVKVADFGLAILFEKQGAPPGPNDKTQSIVFEPHDEAVEGTPFGRRLVGTIHYMSPEQAMGEDLDARSDIFSLGVMLYEMTTGRRPFLGTTATEVLEEIVKASPEPVHTLVPKVPLELDRMVGKALARRRADRYQTMDDLAVDLNRLSKDLDSGSSPSYDDLKAIPGRPRWRRAAAWIGASVVVGALGVLALVGVRAGAFNRTAVDDHTILVLPMAVQGQTDGADYVGLAFSQALAVNLAKAPSLKLLPVPEKAVDESERNALARRCGAGRVLSGMVVREPQGIQVTLSMIDSRSNRLMWGKQSRIDRNDLSAAVASLSRETLGAIGVSTLRLLEPIEYLAPDGPMGRSADLAEALGALRLTNYEAADKATARLVAGFPAEPDAWALRVFTLFQRWWSQPFPERRAQFEAAMQALRQVAPDSFYLTVMRGVIAREDGKLDEAVLILTEALTRDDLTPLARCWALQMRAVAERNAKPEAAERDLLEARALAPTKASVLARLAVLYLQTKRDTEATLAAQQAVALEPTNFDHYRTLGNCYIQTKRYADATDAFKKAVEINRSQATLAKLSLALYKDGRKAEAFDVAREANRLPDDKYGCRELASVWSLAGDRVKALELLRRALAAGYASVSLFDDEDLAAVRGGAEFEAIAAEVRRRIGKK